MLNLHIPKPLIGEKGSGVRSSSWSFTWPSPHPPLPLISRSLGFVRDIHKAVLGSGHFTGSLRISDFMNFAISAETELAMYYSLFPSLDQ
jgi:hypothetical protein